MTFFFLVSWSEVFLGTGFFELRGGEMFFGQKKISRASRAKTLEKLVCGGFGIRPRCGGVNLTKWASSCFGQNGCKVKGPVKP